MDLSTTVLGLKLKNPLIAGASPMTSSLERIKRLEDEGVAAVVMHSLFEEQINHEMKVLDHFLYSSNESYAEATEFFQNDVEFNNIEADDYIKEIENVKKSVDIPLIASLNGVSAGGWAKYASRLEEAGADALELNITYIPTNINLSGFDVEKMYVDTIKLVKKNISIPLNVKMNAYFSSPANMAKRFVEAGASGLTIFDSPVHVDIDLEALSATQKANITSSKNLSETLRWCAILYNQLDCSLCASSGVHSGEDVLKAIMSGADAAALASVLLLHGEKEVSKMLNLIREWMQTHEYDSISQMKGSISLKHTDNPAAYERNSYMSALQNYKK